MGVFGVVRFHPVVDRALCLKAGDDFFEIDPHCNLNKELLCGTIRTYKTTVFVNIPAHEKLVRFDFALTSKRQFRRSRCLGPITRTYVKPAIYAMCRFLNCRPNDASRLPFADANRETIP